MSKKTKKIRYSFIISAMSKSGIFEIMYIITAAIKILRIYYLKLHILNLYFTTRARW